LKIIDISQEVFSACVYPGDPAPHKEILQNMEEGALYNLTAFSMCAHNGTHVDAPKHFIKDGPAIDDIPLEVTVGYCYVARFDGIITRDAALGILHEAQISHPEAAKRLLIAGDAELSLEAAELLAQKGILLFGNESQTVGNESAPMAVHKALLGKNVVLLEGIRLNCVEQGVYILNAAPLNLAGSDGAPTRAILIKP